MLHSAAPSSFNMFPFGHHPPQHPGGGHPHGMVGGGPPHHGDMFMAAHPQQQPPEPPPKPRFLFKMPRVVPNQKEKFESDEFLKRHSREGEVSLGVFSLRKLIKNFVNLIYNMISIIILNVDQLT